MLKPNTVITDFSDYKTSAKALYNKSKGLNENTMQLSITCDGTYFSSKSVNLGEIEYPRGTGLIGETVFDADHLMNSMKDQNAKDEKGNPIPHAHGSSIEDMMGIKKALENPVAILETRPRQDKHGKTFKYAVALSVDKDAFGSPIYRLAVIQPNAKRNQILASPQERTERVTKIVSYYDIDEEKFNEMMKNAQKKDKLLYFSNQEYENAGLNIPGYESQKNVSKFIANYCVKENEEEYSERFERKVFLAIKTVMERHAINRLDNHYETTFPAFEESMDTLSSRYADLDQLANAYSLIKESTNLIKSRDQDLAKTMIELANRKLSMSLDAAMKHTIGEQENIKDMVDSYAFQVSKIYNLQTTGNALQETFAAKAKAVLISQMERAFNNEISMMPKQETKQLQYIKELYMKYNQDLKDGFAPMQNRLQADKKEIQMALQEAFSKKLSAQFNYQINNGINTKRNPIKHALQTYNKYMKELKTIKDMPVELKHSIKTSLQLSLASTYNKYRESQMDRNTDLESQTKSEYVSKLIENNMDASNWDCSAAESLSESVKKSFYDFETYGIEFTPEAEIYRDVQEAKEHNRDYIGKIENIILDIDDKIQDEQLTIEQFDQIFGSNIGQIGEDVTEDIEQ